MLRCEVLKPLPGYPHQPGEVIDADFRNLDALIRQRFLAPIGDRDHITALESRLAGLEAQVRQLQSDKPRRGN